MPKNEGMRWFKPKQNVFWKWRKEKTMKMNGKIELMIARTASWFDLWIHLLHLFINCWFCQRHRTTIGKLIISSLFIAWQIALWIIFSIFEILITVSVLLLFPDSASLKHLFCMNCGHVLKLILFVCCCESTPNQK